MIQDMLTIEFSQSCPFLYPCSYYGKRSAEAEPAPYRGYYGGYYGGYGGYRGGYGYYGKRSAEGEAKPDPKADPSVLYYTYPYSYAYPATYAYTGYPYVYYG